jgi:NAD(P)-dependent dehydrogenase (short-subunit alcohol dehydrogenase family)
MTGKPLALFSLAGRTAIVAGASRGIGAAIATGLAGAGAAVFSCGRSPESLEPAEGVIYRTCDVTDEAGFEKVCREATDTGGKIDAFVFAAGVTFPSASWPQTSENFAQTISINLTAAYQTAMIAARWMRESSSIVFVTSINSALGFPGNPAYVAAKGGLRQLTKALALDLGSRGIRVNALAPGYIRTSMTESSYANPEQRAARTARTMLGRWGEPSDLVGAAIFLVSDASGYVTGQDLFVDGGWTAKGL